MNLLRLIVLLISVASNIAAVDGWSEPVRGLRARFAFGEGRIVSGTRLPDIILELENVSDIGTPMEFDFDCGKSIRYELRTKDGKPAPQPRMMAVDGFVFGPFHITLPHGGTLRFPVTWNGYGITPNFGTMLCTETAMWEIPSSDKTDYFLSATLEVPETPRDPKKGPAWHGSIKIPAAKAPTGK